MPKISVGGVSYHYEDTGGTSPRFIKKHDSVRNVIRTRTQ